MSTIPANAIVNVVPQVLGAGGSGIVLNGMVLTESTRVPINASAPSQPFPNATAVADFFGPASKEAAVAAVYFGGFDNSNIKPANIYFTQYPGSAVSGYLRGDNITSLTLAQLGALSGSLTVLLDGYTHTASSINLSGCTSYSNAAEIIQTGLFASEPTEASFTATIAGTAMTVAAVASGSLAVGQTVTGSSVTANSVIVAQVSGSAGGTGVYTLSQSSTVGSGETMTGLATAGTVTFDSVSGGFVITSGITGTASTAAFATGTLAAPIFLTQATGAVTSQGAAAATPVPFMTSLAAQIQSWATFMTTFDPDGGSGNTLKMQFATWTTQQDNRYAYVAWDTDQSPTVTVPATSSMGYLLAQGNFSGTILIYEPTDINLAAFVCGMAASIDFSEIDGRITLMGKGQTGIVPNVTNQTVGANLIANGYNFYGAYATATTQFNFFNPGSISGPFKWADGYLDEVWLNSAFQNNLMTLIATAKSIPYDAFGRQLIEAACSDTIQTGLAFGAFSPGVVLSASQIAEVNAAAGANIAPIIQQQGYYFQVQPASAAVRQARTTPPINFWYADAGSVQQMTLDSIALLKSSTSKEQTMSITAANAIITVAIPGIFATPQQIKGYSADDIFDIETIEMLEEAMGVDGILTAGFKFVAVPMSISLMADSESVQIFDFWAASQQTGIDAFPGFGQLALPSLQKKWVLNKMYLKGWPPAPSAGKVLKSLKYSLVLGQMIPQPF